MLKADAIDLKDLEQAPQGARIAIALKDGEVAIFTHPSEIPYSGDYSDFEATLVKKSQGKNVIRGDDGTSWEINVYDSRIVTLKLTQKEFQALNNLLWVEAEVGFNERDSTTDLTHDEFYTLYDKLS